MKDGGSAFPVNGFAYAAFPVTSPEPGMTLRDYFAGQALMSLLIEPGQIADSTYQQAAELSYRFADAMLAEREKDDD